MTSGKKLFKDTRFDGELAKCSCGGDAVVVNSGKIPLRFRVCCSECDAETPWMPTHKGACVSWQRKCGVPVPATMSAREMVERALAARRVAGRTKIRLARDLYERAAVCAREVGETVSRWLYLCTRPSNIERARLADIDVPAPLLDAGRDSVVATVDGAHADHGEVRRCVALAVLYCESRRPPPFECGLREGVDYFVERAEE
jgi:hypothetical protein